MALSNFTFALGQMPPDQDGWRKQAVILLDAKTDKVLLRVPYDEAAEILLGVTNTSEP